MTKYAVQSKVGRHTLYASRVPADRNRALGQFTKVPRFTFYVEETFDSAEEAQALADIVADGKVVEV